MNLNLFKEGFDTLPTAVCFFDSRGIVRLVNEKMIEIGNLFLGIINLGILNLKFSRNSRIPRKLLKTKVPYSKLAALSMTL